MSVKVRIPTPLMKLTNNQAEVTAEGGTITDINRWGKRKLAYPIKSFKEGEYYLTQFKIDPSITHELESNLKLTEEILRHLLVRLGT